MRRHRLAPPAQTRLWLLAALTGALMLLAACGGGDDDDGSDTTVRSPFDGGYPRYSDEQSGLSAILGTPDLGMGTNRVSFVLTNELGIVRLPVASVRTFFAPDGADGEREGPVQEVAARFSEFPLGTRGLYVANLDFDRAGVWTIEATVPTADGESQSIDLTFPVAEHPLSPAVGDAAPASTHRTLADVESVHDLSTGAEPDEALYQITIAEALGQAKPLVIVFASPGFCTNALCGPQVEMLTPLRERYGDAVNFIHIDLYENPREVSTDFDAARRTPLLAEWGLDTDEWTFVIDADGRVAARFEAFTPQPEIVAAIDAVLGARAAR